MAFKHPLHPLPLPLHSRSAHEDYLQKTKVAASMDRVNQFGLDRQNGTQNAAFFIMF